MLESLKPGQNVRCTVVKAPRTDDASQTILRLMRKDPTVCRRLRRSQMMRRRHMIVYNRGNRDWYKRATCGKIARVTPGATWSFTYTLEHGRDMKTVEQFLKIEAA
jgi:hypothetical protein